MNINNQDAATDTWGQSIINDFLKDGGFRNLGSKQIAHEQFQNLIEIDYDPDEGWEHRCNALAVWAFICVELEVPSEELELLSFSITSAMDRRPTGEHPLWLGQLAFDLVLFLRYSDLSSALDFTNLALDLFRTIKQAAKSFQAEPKNRDKDFFQEGKLNPDDFDLLLGVLRPQDVRHLSNTQKLLIRLGKSGVNEALYLLVILDMGDGKYQERWLKQAADGVWPANQLAAFYLGNMLLPDNKGKGEAFLKKVRFPSEDDSDFEILCKLALKAKASCLKNRTPYLKSHGDSMDRGRQKDRFHCWGRKAIYVADQWETVERCVISLEEANPIELPEHIHSVTLETGRLVEAFLKWCLSEWFVIANKLDKTTSLSSWRISEINEFFGSTLGNSKDGSPIGLRDLLSLTDFSIGEDGHEIYKLISDEEKPWMVWNSTVNLPTLVIANAVAAGCNEDHPFRHIAKDLLVETLVIFNAAYFIRNTNAHYARPHVSTSRDEAVFWGNEVRSTVDQFMADCIWLLDKKYAVKSVGQNDLPTPIAHP